MFELSAIEIKNFKITGKIFWIYITPRAFSINNINELNKIEYCYDINSKNQLQNLVEFIGNDSYLIFHNISDYNILVKELKFFDLPIEIYRFRSTQEIGNKIFELKKINKKSELKDFCCYYEIIKYPDKMYSGSLYNCIMTAKLFIHLYKDFSEISNKLCTIEAINAENRSYGKNKNIEINKQKIAEIDSLDINLKEKEIKKQKNVDTKTTFITILNNINLNEKENGKYTVYISDSFNKDQNIHFYGGYVDFNNKSIIILQGIVDDAIYLSAGSPGAVMCACEKIIDQAIELKIKILNIFSNITFIANITNKEMKIKSEASKKFFAFIKKKQNIKLDFNYIESSDYKIIKAKKYAINTIDKINTNFKLNI